MSVCNSMGISPTFPQRKRRFCHPPTGVGDYYFSPHIVKKRVVVQMWIESKGELAQTYCSGSQDFLPDLRCSCVRRADR